MTPTLYYTPASAPCRSVHLTAAVAGIPLTLKLIKLQNREHFTPEFSKMNPQQKVPTLDDNGFFLAESRAIMGYLVDQYAKDDSLYPKEPKARAIVNQRLYFDMESLYGVFADYYYPSIFRGAPVDPSKRKKVDKGLELLDKFLDGQDYVAGKNLTIADLGFLTTVTTLEVAQIDVKPYKNITRWLAKLKSEVPNYEEINGVGLKEMQLFARVLTMK